MRNDSNKKQTFVSNKIDSVLHPILSINFSLILFWSHLFLPHLMSALFFINLYSFYDSLYKSINIFLFFNKIQVIHKNIFISFAFVVLPLTQTQTYVMANAFQIEMHQIYDFWIQPIGRFDNRCQNFLTLNITYRLNGIPFDPMKCLSFSSVSLRQSFVN